MSNLETLKQELIYQKEVIENKGGTVLVANTNPSPSEITKGIESISMLDTSSATASESDVAYGKTFYSGNSSLRTGTNIYNEDYVKSMIFHEPDETTILDRTPLNIPAGTKTIHRYTFYKNGNPFDVTFNEELERIEDYAFNGCADFVFTNFSDLENLNYIGGQTFYGCNESNFDFANLPDSLSFIGTKNFQDMLREGDDLILPEALDNMGTYVFSCNTYTRLNSFYLPSTYSKTLQSYTFQNISCHCDFTTPTPCYEITNYFMYKGSFDNITVSSAMRALGSYCFGGPSTDTVENYHLRTVTFESTNVLEYIGTQVFALQHLENGLKIYVPDEAVEEFKAHSGFKTYYANYIYPVSEKE